MAANRAEVETVLQAPEKSVVSKIWVLDVRVLTVKGPLYMI